MIRLYFDEDSMQQALVQALRLRQVDVRTALEAGRIQCTDADHLRFAAIDDRVLYSFNVGDFCRLHGEFLAQGTRHAGIVLARQQQYSVGGQLRRLLNLVANLSESEMENRIEFLSAWG